MPFTLRCQRDRKANDPCQERCMTSAYEGLFAAPFEMLIDVRAEIMQFDYRVACKRNVASLLLPIIQKRRSFSVLANNRTLVSGASIGSKQLGSGDCGGNDEEYACNDDCKDPLESHNLGCKLTQSKCCEISLARIFGSRYAGAYTVQGLPAPDPWSNP